MEGLAKSATINIPIEVSSQTSQAIPIFDNGIPLDILDYFQVDIRKSDGDAKTKLREIYGILRNDYPNMGDLITELSKIDRKLGIHGYQETRYGRIWNYLKVTSRIKDLEKQKAALEKINA